MKHIIKKVSIAVMALALTSCVKDHLAVDPELSNNVIEFANSGSIASPVGAVHPRYAIDLGNLAPGDSSTFLVNLSYSGAEENAPNDITITLAVDAGAVDAYNADQGSSYSVPPASAIRMPTTVVIKRGEGTVQVPVTIVRSADYDFDTNYALPLKIANVSSGIISGNFGIALYALAPRNEFDGIYEMTGTLIDASVSTITAFPTAEVSLITYNSKSVAMWDDNVAGNYGHPIKNGSTNSYYGDFSPRFVFDATGKVVTVDNYYGQQAGANRRGAQLDATGVNQIVYDQEGKVVSFQVKYVMTQNGAARTTFTETFTYKSPRPR